MSGFPFNNMDNRVHVHSHLRNNGTRMHCKEENNKPIDAVWWITEHFSFCPNLRKDWWGCILLCIIYLSIIEGQIHFIARAFLQWQWYLSARQSTWPEFTSCLEIVSSGTWSAFLWLPNSPDLNPNKPLDQQFCSTESLSCNLPQLKLLFTFWQHISEETFRSLVEFMLYQVRS